MKKFFLAQSVSLSMEGNSSFFCYGKFQTYTKENNGCQFQNNKFSIIWITLNQYFFKFGRTDSRDFYCTWE